VDEFKKLANSDVDANTPNSAGRLPLHTFCSTPWMHDEFPLDEQGPRPAMEWLLQHTNEINTPDQDGIKALQIASIMS
jgi:ankyrin repeat protein